jgi:trk system potassium uptake protein TrkH
MARVLALVSFVVSLCMALPLAVAWLDGSSDVRAFAAAMSAGLCFSCSVYFICGGRIPPHARLSHEYDGLGAREAFAIVGGSWVAASVTGALPFLLSGALGGFTDSFFESVSGFSTTGATVFSNVETLPRSILLWRVLTHWLGGIGIVVLSLAVLPFIGVGGLELYKIETTGPKPEKIAPRMRQTAVFLLEVYVSLTVAETLLLTLGGMSVFDALTHSMSTVATGGYSNKNASIAAYHSPFIEWVIAAFMFMAGVNFSLHFMLLTGAWRKVSRDEELRLYVGVTAVAIIVFTVILSLHGHDAWDALRAAAFQVTSFMTTTGFVSTDYAQWPQFNQCMLLFLALAGGCAGSTAGGLKMMRLLVLRRGIGVEVKNMFHPRAILRARVNGKVLSERAMTGVLAFFTLYVAVLIGAFLLVIAVGWEKLDIPTAFFGVLSSLSNLGPGLGNLGATDNYDWLPGVVKWVLAFCMLAGRLELYSMFFLLHPATWRK